jgi:hypothetical protein
MTDLATLGFHVDTGGLKSGSDALDQFGAKAKAAGASVAQGAETAKAANTVTAIYAKAVKDAAAQHAAFSTQGQAAFHAARSMAEGIAMGIPPAQMLGMQLNHLSYAASGPGGIIGAFSEATRMLASMLTPMRLVVGGGAAVAGAFYLIYQSIQTTELKFADLQDRIGGTLQSLHGLQEAAYLKGGVGQDDFLAGMEKFGSLVVEAQHGLGSMAGLFRANGVAISSDMNVNLAKVADLISRASSQQEKYRLIVEAGLPPTRQWVQFLSQGGDAILQASQQANGFGSYAEQQMINKARDFDTAWNRAWTEFGNRAKQTVVDTAQLLRGLVQQGEGAAQSFGNAQFWTQYVQWLKSHGLYFSLPGAVPAPPPSAGGPNANSRVSGAFGELSPYQNDELQKWLNKIAGIRTSQTNQDALHNLQIAQPRVGLFGSLPSAEELSPANSEESKNDCGQCGLPAQAQAYPRRNRRGHLRTRRNDHRLCLEGLRCASLAGGARFPRHGIGPTSRRPETVHAV